MPTAEPQIRISTVTRTRILWSGELLLNHSCISVFCCSLMHHSPYLLAWVAFMRKHALKDMHFMNNEKRQNTDPLCECLINRRIYFKENLWEMRKEKHRKCIITIKLCDAKKKKSAGICEHQRPISRRRAGWYGHLLFAYEIIGDWIIHKRR